MECRFIEVTLTQDKNDDREIIDTAIRSNLRIFSNGLYRNFDWNENTSPSVEELFVFLANNLVSYRLHGHGNVPIGENRDTLERLRRNFLVRKEQKQLRKEFHGGYTSV